MKSDPGSGGRRRRGGVRAAQAGCFNWHQIKDDSRWLYFERVEPPVGVAMAHSWFVIHIKYDNISTFIHKYVVRFAVKLRLKNYKHGWRVFMQTVTWSGAGSANKQSV